MQIVVPKCNLHNFHRIQSTTPFISSSFLSYFRSTPTSSKNKCFNTPTFIRYKTRQKRADAKKALNDIYFGSGSSKFTLEGEYLKKRWKKSWDDDPTEHKNRRDPSARRWWDGDRTEHKNRRESKAHQKRKKMEKSKHTFEEFDDPEKHFQATFGNRRYFWSFKSWEESFSQSKKSGCKYSNTRNKWRTVSDDDDESSEDDDSYVVGSHSDRVALGLPTNGPLKIEEIKNAFRLSALKWHPDKHQGPSQSLFLKIVSDVEAYDEWFQEGLDGRMKKSFTPLQKVTSAIKQLATGNPTCKRYGGEFLRRPTSHDIALLYQAHEDRHHLPGMLGSLDCTHFVWRMCPTELRGQYMRGDHQYPTVMLEAVASQDLWIWHAFCGPAGSQNDINVLQQSPLFLAQPNGTAPNCPFQVNNHLYKRGYYLTDGIYPTWSVFVKSFPYPHDPNEKKFKRQHEAARKDVERAFGVLKSKWGILNRPMRSKTVRKIRSIVYTPYFTQHDYKRRRKGDSTGSYSRSSSRTRLR
ncbi:putative harbinger transposase-derived protein [Helianthus annuus]|nr:putative harbinger transposase-derived protein [Helianthus annuus]